MDDHADRRSAIEKLIRTIPDHPRPGILFRDITTLLKSAHGLRLTITSLLEAADKLDSFDVIVGIEARGFVLGGAMALEAGCGFVPVRKPGKLPGRRIAQDYQLEYGTDTLEIHQDALEQGQKVLLVDDLIATGGTMAAATSLIRRLGAEPVGAVFLINLAELGGVELLVSQGIKSQYVLEMTDAY